MAQSGNAAEPRADLVEAGVRARHLVVEVVQLVHREGLLPPALVDLGSGRAAASETEAPNMLANLV